MKLSKTNQMLDSAPGWSNSRHKSELGEEWQESSLAEGGLGVLVGRKLNGISSVCAKGANLILGCIKHSITSQPRGVVMLLNSALVQPHLEYCVQFWAPLLKRDVKVLEHVLRRAPKQGKGLAGMCSGEH